MRQIAEFFFIPEDIGEIGQFISHIMIGDTQVIPVFIPPREDVEAGSPSVDLSFILAGSFAQQDKFSGPIFLRKFQNIKLLARHSLYPYWFARTFSILINSTSAFAFPFCYSMHSYPLQ